MATVVSLLERLRGAPPNSTDWGRFHAIYLPLIRSWIGRIPALGDDPDDVAQEVFAIVARELPGFDRRREGSFRAWLRRVTVNKLRTSRRRLYRRRVVGLDPTDGFLEGLAAPESEMAREWDRDHDRHVFEALVEAVRPDFSPTSWEAFRRFGLDGASASVVAGELGISENAVLRAKYRILKRLREEAGDFLS